MSHRPPITLLLLALLAVAAPAAGMPPALVWSALETAPAPAEAPRTFASLVVRLDGAGAGLVSAAIAEGAVKLKPRAPRGDGLFFVVRDEASAPLLIGESFDARFVLFGDEPDPSTGTLRSLSVMRDEATFPLRVPLPPGARDVALFVLADPRQPVTAAELLDAVRARDASLIPRGVLALPQERGASAP